MSHDLKNRGPADRSRINVNEPWEVKYRRKEFALHRATVKAGNLCSRGFGSQGKSIFEEQIDATEGVKLNGLNKERSRASAMQTQATKTTTPAQHVGGALHGVLFTPTRMTRIVLTDRTW